MSTIEKKILIVGDGAVGKTCILIVRTQGQMPRYEPTPTIFDIFETEVDVNGRQILLSIWDLSGLAEYSNMRQVAYPHTDAILMCYSPASTHSVANIIDRWLPEVRKFCPNVPIVLVRTKLDLKYDPDGIAVEEQVTNQLVMKVKDEVQPDAHIEYSSVTKQGIDDVFIAAATASLEPTHVDQAVGIIKCCVVS